MIHTVETTVQLPRIDWTKVTLTDITESQPPRHEMFDPNNLTLVDIQESL